MAGTPEVRRFLHPFHSKSKKERIPDLKASQQTIFERLLALASRFGRADSFGKYADEEPPLRSELFSADQMEQHGKNLAAAHRLAPGRAPDRLLARLAENERILIDVCDLLTAAVTANRRITPAAEWLLDNFYLIEEQIRTAKRHLPKGYSRELPRLAHGPSAEACRASTTSRSKRSRTATAGSTRRACRVSSPPTRR